MLRMHFLVTSANKSGEPTTKYFDDVVKAFENVSSGVRMSVVILIKRMVSEGKLNDVKTIRALEKHLGIDLISLLD